MLGLPVIPDKPVVRQSLITACEDCPRKMMWQYTFGLRPTSRSQAMDTGSYAHAVLEVLANGGKVGDASDECAGMFKKVMDDVSCQYGNDVNSIPPSTKDQRTEDLNMGIAMGIEGWGVLRPRIESGQLKLIGSEIPIDLKLRLNDGTKTGTEVQVRGKVDLAFQDLKGKIWPLDFKTAGKNEDLREWGTSANRRIQALLYTECFRQWASPTPKAIWDAELSQLTGFLYLVLMKPTIIRKWKSGQSLEEYVVEAHEWWSGTGKHSDKHDDRKSNPACMVHPVHVPNPLPTWAVRRILALRDEQVRVLERINNPESPIPLWDFTPHERHCKMGNMVCAYNDLCNDEQGKNWKELVGKRYTERPDPLDSDESRNKR
jgi:hypothetical protein